MLSHSAAAQATDEKAESSSDYPSIRLHIIPAGHSHQNHEQADLTEKVWKDTKQWNKRGNREIVKLWCNSLLEKGSPVCHRSGQASVWAKWTSAAMSLHFPYKTSACWTFASLQGPASLLLDYKATALLSSPFSPFFHFTSFTFYGRGGGVVYKKVHCGFVFVSLFPWDIRKNKPT